MKHSQKGSSNVETLASLIVGIVFFVIFTGCTLAYQSMTREDRVVTINEKVERCESKDSCKYLVFTDKGVFQNTDTWFNWKFDSSDFQNNLKTGKTYEIQTTGLRVPFLSMYPNIVKMKEQRNEQLSW